MGVVLHLPLIIMVLGGYGGGPALAVVYHDFRGGGGYGGGPALAVDYHGFRGGGVLGVAFIQCL